MKTACLIVVVMLASSMAFGQRVVQSYDEDVVVYTPPVASGVVVQTYGPAPYRYDYDYYRYGARRMGRRGHPRYYRSGRTYYGSNPYYYGPPFVTRTGREVSSTIVTEEQTFVQ
ncbi:MAG: hypothetical protein P9M03_08665 [Candidatus Theseobacter exili]|nr:hypothetical protein [Candidatus Theseobacter exili]